MFSIRPDGLETVRPEDSLALRDFAQWRQVPNLHGLVKAGRGELLPVRAERDPPDDTRMTAEGANRFAAGLGVPEFHEIIPAPRGDPATVGAEGHAPDRGAVAAAG